MAQSTSNATPQEFAWLEGIRILAAAAILLYHAQLYFTDYAHTLQPTGWLDNLQRIGTANIHLGQGWLLQLLATPVWVGLWFVPLILSLVLGFPLLWWLLQRWGIRNLLIVSLLAALSYRAVYCLGDPTYVSLETPAGESPFLSLLTKIDTFVCGMAAAQLYLQRRGLFTWRPVQLLGFGSLCYALGFGCQFSRAGWVVADLLVSVGLTTCCMVIFRSLEQFTQVRQAVLELGSHSYSYFLIHNFVVDRSINLIIGSNLLLYYVMLPIMAIGTLIFSVMADYTTPLIRRIVLAFLQDLDYVLTTSPERQVRTWNPNVGDRVRYRGESGWTILKVERLLDDKELCLCQVSDDDWMTWLSAEELEPDRGSPADLKDEPKSSLSCRLDSQRLFHS